MENLEVVEYESAKKLSLKDRKYVLAHDDDTGKLIVYIVKDFTDYEVSDSLDEVFAYWQDDKFVFCCILDNKKAAYSPEGRFKIFEGHLRNSLVSILSSERKLEVDDLKLTLREVYKSNDPKLNLVREDKNLYDYVYTSDGFVKYQKGFDYKSLSKYKK